MSRLFSQEIDDAVRRRIRHIAEAQAQERARVLKARADAPTIEGLRAENQRLREALSTLAAKLPAPDVLDAVDDDGMTGARAVIVRLTIAEARALWAVIPPALPVRGGR